MVESASHLDLIFASLANPTRRDILSRVIGEPMSIGNLANHYKMSFAAVAKHIFVMEKAKLIQKKSIGKEKIISANPQTLEKAQACISNYEKIWQQRYDNLENLLNN